jgi:hypothetical protein
MSLSTKVKTALDETRLLMLGAQVLFGFQLNGVFQEEFASLSLASRYVDCAGQVLMAMAIGLLVAPSMQHRIVENGEDTVRIHRITGIFAGMALLMIWLTLFMIRRPVEDEPNGARRHCHILLALILANALIGPLPRQADRNRQKEYRQIAQKVFMIFTVGCCAAWIRFGDAIPEEADAQSLADHPSSPCRASYSRQRP